MAQAVLFLWPHLHAPSWHTSLSASSSPPVVPSCISTLISPGKSSISPHTHVQSVSEFIPDLCQTHSLVLVYPCLYLSKHSSPLSLTRSIIFWFLSVCLWRLWEIHPGLTLPASPMILCLSTTSYLIPLFGLSAPLHAHLLPTLFHLWPWALPALLHYNFNISIIPELSVDTHRPTNSDVQQELRNVITHLIYLLLTDLYPPCGQQLFSWVLQ